MSEDTSAHVEESAVPVELRVFEFEENIKTLTNEYLSDTSAIFIVPFMEQITDELRKIANIQSAKLKEKYRDDD